MEKLTSGQGWSLSSDEKPQPVKKSNPHSPRAQIRLEKRNGKVVTVIAGLHTYGADRLGAMAKELKAACGVGGTVKNGVIEIQGEKQTFVRDWIAKNITAGQSAQSR